MARPIISGARLITKAKCSIRLCHETAGSQGCVEVLAQNDEPQRAAAMAVQKSSGHLTDRLRSYRAAMNVIGNAERREANGRWINNRAENSINRSGDESERWRASGVRNRFRNSPRSTLQFTTISAKCVISAAANTLKSIAPLPWPSGVYLPPEIRRSRGSATQLVFF